MAKKQIQWTGDNLREVIEFTGLHPKFNDWFNSWEEYEEYVRTHDSIFKLYRSDCISYFSIYPGCYIERDDEKITNRCYPVTEGKYKLKEKKSLV